MPVGVRVGGLVFSWLITHTHARTLPVDNTHTYEHHLTTQRGIQLLSITNPVLPPSRHLPTTLWMRSCLQACLLIYSAMLHMCVQLPSAVTAVLMIWCKKRRPHRPVVLKYSDAMPEQFSHWEINVIQSSITTTIIIQKGTEVSHHYSFPFVKFMLVRSNV